MCSFCKGNSAFFNEVDEEDKALGFWDMSIYFDENKLIVEENVTGNSGKYKFEIKYCPYCGRALHG